MHVVGPSATTDSLLSFFTALSQSVTRHSPWDPHPPCKMEDAEIVWGNLHIDKEEEENQDDNSGSELESEMSDASSGGYLADVDTSDSDEAPPDDRDSGVAEEEEEEDEEEFWQKFSSDLSTIADEQGACNRPE